MRESNIQNEFSYDSDEKLLTNKPVVNIFDGNIVSKDDKRVYQTAQKFNCQNDFFCNTKENILPFNSNLEDNDVTPSPKYNTPLMKINDSYRTPIRNRDVIRFNTPGTPFTRTPTQDPMIETPNGSRMVHPFFSNIMRNHDKSIMSPNMFSLNENSVRDKSTLSPDLAGTLFPADIDCNMDLQYHLESVLYKQYGAYLNKKSDIFFEKGAIAPSPLAHDSGLGTSLQTSNQSLMEPDRCSSGPMNLLVHNTPPSKYKWNRDEYRNTSPTSQSMELCYESDEDSIDFSSAFNMESTKIFDGNMGLAFNLSMRDHSIIESPAFANDDRNDIFMSYRDGDRSSPNSKYNSVPMDDLEISPIKISRNTFDDEFD